MAFFEFPHTRTYDSDLGWLIRRITRMSEELKNFINLNTIKYADPIAWDITRQYETNTVVINPLNGTAYISTRPVPSGVLVTNTDYWTPIFNYAASLEEFRREFVELDNGENPNAETAYNTGSVFWWKGDLWRAVTDIPAGSTLIPDTNVQKITFQEYVEILMEQLYVMPSAESMAAVDYRRSGYVRTLGYYAPGDHGGAYYELLDAEPEGEYVRLDNGRYARLIIGDVVTPQMFGAVGDGASDDSAAFQKMFGSGCDNVYIPPAEYYISDIIVIEREIEVEDQGAYPLRKPVWPRSFDITDFSMFGFKKEYTLRTVRSYAEGITYDGRRNHIYIGAYNYEDTSATMLDLYIMDTNYNILETKQFPIAAVASLNYDSITDTLWVTTTGSGGGRTNALYPIDVSTWTLGEAVITPDDNQFVTFDPVLKTFVMFYINGGTPNLLQVRVYNHDMTETLKSFDLYLDTADAPQQGIGSYNGHIYTPTFSSIVELDYAAEKAHRVCPLPVDRGYEELEDFAVLPGGKIIGIGHRDGVDGTERIYEYGFNSYKNVYTISPPVVMVDLNPLTEPIEFAPGEQKRTPDYTRPMVDGYRIISMCYSDISGPGAGNLLMNGSLAGTSISIYNPHATATLTLNSMRIRFIFLRNDLYEEQRINI